MSRLGAALLQIAGFGSLAIALLQFVMYYGGAEVYRICGTPERWIRQRLEKPVLSFFIEVALALLFAAFAADAFSAAGTIRPLPLLRLGLGVTAAIYVGRGLLLIPQVAGYLLPQYPNLGRLYSLIALLMGFCYALPLYWYWNEIGRSS